MIALAWVTAARADYHALQESVVVGGSVVIALGPVMRGQRLGLGLDLGKEFQHYWERADRIHGTFTVWAEEAPDLNYGPVAHVWWVGGVWSSSIGARVGATWPLRMGLEGGWWPGPGLAGEVAATMSTAGLVAVDLQGVVDGPWVGGRLGASLNLQGWAAERLSVGLFTPVLQPENWPGTKGDVWDPDHTPP